MTSSSIGTLQPALSRRMGDRLMTNTSTSLLRLEADHSLGMRWPESSRGQARRQPLPHWMWCCSASPAATTLAAHWVTSHAQGILLHTEHDHPHSTWLRTSHWHVLQTSYQPSQGSLSSQQQHSSCPCVPCQDPLHLATRVHLVCRRHVTGCQGDNDRCPAADRTMSSTLILTCTDPAGGWSQDNVEAVEQPELWALPSRCLCLLSETCPPNRHCPTKQMLQSTKVSA